MVMPKKKKQGRAARFFERFAVRITRATGRPMAFVIAALFIVIWAASGPLFGFSDTWQLVINTSTTIVTFLMVFVIQHSQNKDTVALQLKLNELIAASEHTSNRLIDIEDIDSEELETLKKFYVKLAALAQKESNIFKTHSIDEAGAWHEKKSPARKKTGTSR